MVRLLCISLLVGICFAVSGAPKQPQALTPEPRLTEISKLSQQIKAAAAAVGDKKQPYMPMPYMPMPMPFMPPDSMAADTQSDDCSEPPPRRCRHWSPHHDSHDPNSPSWVRANVVGMGQLPDDDQIKMPKWIPARTVPFLPEEAAASGAGGPCCICPQCGLSFYTPNDYWGHIPQCIAGPPPCVQTSPCLGNSHFDSDPRVCMCRPGIISSSIAAAAASAGATGTADFSSSSSTGEITPGLQSSSSSTFNSTIESQSSGPLATGSIGDSSSGGGLLMVEFDDIQQIGEDVGEQVIQDVENGIDVGPI